MAVHVETGAVPGLLQFSRQAVLQALARCAASTSSSYVAAVDGTCGNGHDSLFLAQSLKSVSKGKAFGLWAFDVQQEAIEATRAAMANEGYASHISLVAQCHSKLTEALSRPEYCPPSLAALPLEPLEGLRIAAAMYNLGFLPRSDKRVTTLAATTLVSLESAAAALLPQGVLAVHAYGGHPGGQEELEAVSHWYSRLPFDEWTAASYTLCNKNRNPETLFLAEKRVRS